MSWRIALILSSGALVFLSLRGGAEVALVLKDLGQAAARAVAFYLVIMLNLWIGINAVSIDHAIASAEHARIDFENIPEEKLNRRDDSVALYSTCQLAYTSAIRIDAVRLTLFERLFGAIAFFLIFSIGLSV
jgi:hypothetical protein